MDPVTVPARDGLALHSYLTPPQGMEAAGLPLVLNVHGGPWPAFLTTWRGEVRERLVSTKRAARRAEAYFCGCSLAHSHLV